jgi:hypothetical protein
MRVKELVRNQRVVWECIEQFHESDTLSVHDEWVGTILRWDIEPQPGGSRVAFVHEGLVPKLQCYEICEAGWDRFFVASLKSFLETGVGQPFASPGG